LVINCSDYQDRIWPAPTVSVFTAPSALAMQVIPPTASSSGKRNSGATSGVSHHSGLYSWEIALIVVGGVPLLAGIAAFFYKLSRRPAAQPALN
jgi:hypothetical protein